MLYYSILHMSDDILREIQVLKKDVGSSMDRLARLRYAELREAFAGEMRLALAEEGRRWAGQGFERIGASECGYRESCLMKLSDAVGASIDDFCRGRPDEASAGLDRTLELLCGSGSPCQSDECSRMAAETVRRTRMLLGVWSRIGADVPDAAAAAEAEPERVEEALGPLANAKRVQMLRALRAEPKGLSELGRSMGMRTGHLMFHVNALRDAGYIASDARTRLYSLTPSGRAALDGMDELMSRIGRAGQA